MNTDQVSEVSECHNSNTECQSGPRAVLNSDDSFTYNGIDLWNLVSEESFLEEEKRCQSLAVDAAESILGESDTTFKFDVEEPTFVMRRLTTIIEESTIKEPTNIKESNINKESTGSTISVSDDNSPPLKQSAKQVSDKSTLHSYRPSMVNIFPTIDRIGFYDYMDTMMSSAKPQRRCNITHKENSKHFGESTGVTPAAHGDKIMDKTAGATSPKNDSCLKKSLERRALMCISDNIVKK